MGRSGRCDQQDTEQSHGGGPRAAGNGAWSLSQCLIKEWMCLPTHLAVTGGGRSASVRLSSRRSLSRAAGCPRHVVRASCPEPPNISYSQFHTQRSAGSGAEKDVTSETRSPIHCRFHDGAKEMGTRKPAQGQFVTDLGQVNQSEIRPPQTACGQILSTPVD